MRIIDDIQNNTSNSIELECMIELDNSSILTIDYIEV